MTKEVRPTINAEQRTRNLIENCIMLYAQINLIIEDMQTFKENTNNA